MEPPVNRLKLYQEAKKIVEARIGFFIHLGIYLAVNFLLFLINLTTLEDTDYWFVWPVIFWGTVVLIHGVFVLFFTAHNIRRFQEKIQGWKARQMLMGLGLHWSLFILLNLLLLAANYLTARSSPDVDYWSVWIIFGWGIGIAFHSIWVYLNKDHKLKRWKRRKALQILDKWGKLP